MLATGGFATILSVWGLKLGATYPVVGDLMPLVCVVVTLYGVVSAEVPTLVE